MIALSSEIGRFFTQVLRYLCRIIRRRIDLLIFLLYDKNTTAEDFKSIKTIKIDRIFMFFKNIVFARGKPLLSLVNPKLWEK